MCGSVSGNPRSGSGCGEGCNGVGRGFLPDCALIASNVSRTIRCAQPRTEGRVGIGAAGYGKGKSCCSFGRQK